MKLSRIGIAGWPVPVLAALLIYAPETTAAATGNPENKWDSLSHRKQAAGARGRGSSRGYPVSAVFGAFRRSCSQLQSFRIASRQASSGGWAPVSNISNTPLARVAASARRDGRHGRVQYFQQSVAGENLFLMLTQGNARGRPIITCRLIDFDETRRITAGDVSALIGRQPTETTREGEQVYGAGWQPGLSPQQEMVVLRHAPAGHPEFSGVMLVAIQRDADEE